VTRKSAAVGVVAVALGALLMLSLAWGLQHAALANPPLLGRTAPQLAIRTVAGDQVSVSSLRGEPVVVNFWASWCTPCIQESAVLSAAASSRPDVKFVGADNRDTTSGFQTFEQRHPHPYPAGPIVQGSYQSYGVAGLPATFFINSDGLVVASFSGALDAPTLSHYLALIAP
jgi:cytochrome c biogenesis protein CcmG, thiol:disulfide interchange protein DsbE